MLALSRVMMTAPRLLMIDELALGLAPMTVERLMGMVRRINESGTTVILVEQSLNRALSLADRCFFMERGEIRFDGPTAELMARDDLLRPVFLGTAAAGPGLGAVLAFSAPNFVLVQGVFYGLGYGLLALGLVLVYRTNRVLNFAQGQIGVIAAVFLVKLTADFKFNYWFALVLSDRPGRARRRAVRAGAAAALQPAPGARHGGHDRAELRAARAHRAAVHPAVEPLQAGAGALRPVVLPGPVHHHPDRGADAHRRPHRDRWPWCWPSA